MTISVDMLKLKGLILWDPSSKQRTTGREWLIREGELDYPRGKPLNHSIQSGQF